MCVFKRKFFLLKIILFSFGSSKEMDPPTDIMAFKNIYTKMINYDAP